MKTALTASIPRCHVERYTRPSCATMLMGTTSAAFSAG
jgi:hypothetical protein